LLLGWGHEAGARTEVHGEWLIPHPNPGTSDSEIWYEVRDRPHARIERLAKPHAGTTDSARSALHLSIQHFRVEYPV